MLDAIAFDGDDTLWHNEGLFSMTQERFRALLADAVERRRARRAAARDRARERRGVRLRRKGFTLSMIETAIEVTNGNVDADTIYRILAFAKDQLSHPVELLPGVDRDDRRARRPLPAAADHQGRPLRPGEQDRALGPGRTLRRDRGGRREGARRLPPRAANGNGIDPARVPDGRQLRALGRAARARGRRPGRAASRTTSRGSSRSPSRRTTTTATGRSTTSARSRRSSPSSSRPTVTAGDRIDDAMNPYEAAERPRPRRSATLTGVERHDVAVVLGSGWGDAAAELGEVVWEGPLDEVPGHAATDGRRPHGPPRLGRRRRPRGARVRRAVASLRGAPRRTPSCTAVRTAVLAGCAIVVLTNAAGGLDPDVPVGTPVLLPTTSTSPGVAA